MGPKGLFEGWHIVILILVVVIVFGWKRLPDAARGLGRSMRIFKSEVDEMKKDGKTTPSAASSDTVKGETVHSDVDADAGKDADPTWNPTANQTAGPAKRETHNQPPA